MTTSERHEPTVVGLRLRQLRHAQGKSLSVVAGLAGISAAHLCRLETGRATLDRLSLIVALAELLHVSPVELIKLRLWESAQQTSRARCAARADGSVR